MCGCKIGSIIKVGCLYWVPFTDHTTAGQAIEPAEIKQQATSARNLQQIEGTEQNKPLSHLIPSFFTPFLSFCPGQEAFP